MSGFDHGWNTAGTFPAMFAGARICMSGRNALGTAVWATESAESVAPGVPVTYGLSELLPDDATVRIPTSVAFSTASDRSSSNGCP